jgi:hypothetical protein
VILMMVAKLEFAATRLVLAISTAPPIPEGNAPEQPAIESNSNMATIQVNTASLLRTLVDTLSTATPTFSLNVVV